MEHAVGDERDKGRNHDDAADVASVERLHARGGLPLVVDEAVEDLRVDRARRRGGRRGAVNFLFESGVCDLISIRPNTPGRIGSRCHTVREDAASVAASIAWNISRLAFKR